MKKSLEEILKELNEDLKNKKDLIINQNDIYVNSENGRVGLNGSEYKLNDWSTSQFCSRLNGINPKYYSTSPYEVQAYNANYWLKEDEENKNKNHMFRVREGEEGKVIRGILSEKYSPFDDHEIVEILNEILKDFDDYEIVMWNRNDEGFHLRIVFNNLTSEVGKLLDGRPDIHKVGVHIENSEVGKKSIRIKPLVYRLVCSNGMMAWRTDGEVFQQRHIGLTHNEMYRRVAEALVVAIKAGDETLEKLMKLKDVVVIDPIKEIEKLAESFKYSKKFTEHVKEMFNEEPKKNAFYVVQAFTAGAKSLEGDRRVEVERDAGKMLDRFLRVA